MSKKKRKRNPIKGKTRKPPKLLEAKESTAPSAATENIDLNERVIPVLNALQSLTPYDIFIRCIKRAENLIAFHQEGSTAELEERFCDAYRAAIVLSISALDAFVRSLVIEKIKVTLSNKSVYGVPHS